MMWAVYVCVSVGSSSYAHQLRRLCTVRARHATEALAIGHRLLALLGLTHHGVDVYQTSDTNAHFDRLRSHRAVIRSGGFVTYHSKRGKRPPKQEETSAFDPDSSCSQDDSEILVGDMDELSLRDLTTAAI